MCETGISRSVHPCDTIFGLDFAKFCRWLFLRRLKVDVDMLFVIYEIAELK